MKNKIFNIIMISLCVISSIIAQDVPSAFNYQGVAFDANGLVVSESQIGIKFSIFTNDGTEMIQYSESQQVRTSALGYFAAEIGRGDILDGSITDISWTNGPYYLNVGLDLTGDGDYKDVGSILIQSVPYALVTKASGNQPTGRMGEPGQNGVDGPMGATGPAGPQGPSGAVGTQCPVWNGSPGLPGAQGPTGPAGPPGPAGAQGPDGTMIGATGPQGDSFGPAGPKGPDGPEGIKGDPGPAGPAGLEGPIAANGVPGPAGDPGVQGIGGGPFGPVGPQGETGPPGLDGLPAAQGAQGPQGYTQLRMTNEVPATNFQNIYLDDGTNRTDGTPGFRFWNGTNWIDIKTSN